MSLLKCVKCSKQCIFKRRPKEDEVFGVPCDYCNEAWCKECARISATEIDTLTLTQRLLMFYCTNCKCF